MNESGVPEISAGKNSLLKILFYLVVPFLVIGVYIFGLYLSLSPEDFEILLGLMVINLLPPAGKESVIPIGIAMGLPWYVMGTTTAMMDVSAALFMVLNFDLALKIPVLGRWIHVFMEKGNGFFVKYRWLEGLSIFGLMLFVMIPFQGSGGIGGTILGRMLGLPKLQLFLGIAAGAFLGSYLIAVGFEFVTEVLAINPVYLALAIVVVVIMASIINYLRKRSRREDTPEDGE